jgi:biotin carboxyl carrier protein
VKYTVTAAGRSFEIEVDHDRLVRVDGQSVYVDLEQIGAPPLYALELDDASYLLFVEDGQGEYRVEVQGRIYPVQVRQQPAPVAIQPVECSGQDGDCLMVSAPLAGRLVALPMAASQRVEVGQVVAVVESMKMQIELKAPRPGVVESVHGPPGRDVSQGERLVTLRVE